MRVEAGLMWRGLVADVGETNGGESRYLPKMGSFRRLTAARAAIFTNRT
jgi:hypothetical protein